MTELNFTALETNTVRWGHGATTSTQYDQERSHPENQATMFPGPADGTQFFFSTKKLEKSLAYGQTRTWFSSFLDDITLHGLVLVGHARHAKKRVTHKPTQPPTQHTHACDCEQQELFTALV